MGGVAFEWIAESPADQDPHCLTAPDWNGSAQSEDYNTAMNNLSRLQRARRSGKLTHGTYIRDVLFPVFEKYNLRFGPQANASKCPKPQGGIWN